MDWETADLARDFTPGIAPKGPSASSYHIVIAGGEALATEGSPWRPLTADEWRWCGLESLSSHYLGALGEVPIFAEEVAQEAKAPEGYAFASLWSLLTRLPPAAFYLAGRARQVVDWHQQHRHCGACGSATQASPDDRSRKCAACGLAFYPRLSPSVIVLVHKGDEILLARNAHSTRNFYSTLAGFVEPGESIEDTVHREVFEEVGIKVKNLRYFASQSWPFPNSLMLGFHAEYASGEIRLQEDEIADAGWFHYASLPNPPAMASISGWLIDAFIKRQEG